MGQLTDKEQCKKPREMCGVLPLAFFVFGSLCFPSFSSRVDTSADDLELAKMFLFLSSLAVCSGCYFVSPLSSMVVRAFLSFYVLPRDALCAIFVQTLHVVVQTINLYKCRLRVYLARCPGSFGWMSAPGFLLKLCLPRTGDTGVVVMSTLLLLCLYCV